MPTITQERLNYLEKRDRILSALYAGGVDNWDGYDFSMEAIWDEEKEQPHE